MAFTTTTLTAAMAETDTAIKITAATGFVAGDYVKIDDEFMQIISGYNGTDLTVKVLRAQNGTTRTAHAIKANVVTAPVSQTAVSDWTGPNAAVTTSYALAARRRKVISYGAAGAIALPNAGEDVLAIINGTVAFAMTLANPTADMDGSELLVASNGKAAHTVTYSAGLGNAGAGYTVATFTTGAQQTLALIAINSIWQQRQSQFSGTLTAIQIALA
jgi:hypothetical protein